jgi:hypothetical protein
VVASGVSRSARVICCCGSYNQIYVVTVRLDDTGSMFPLVLGATNLEGTVLKHIVHLV